jgi:hypothetical protein
LAARLDENLTHTGSARDRLHEALAPTGSTGVRNADS